MFGEEINFYSNLIIKLLKSELIKLSSLFVFPVLVGQNHIESHFSRISSWLIEKWNRNLKIKPNKQSNPKEQSEKESIPAGFKGMKKVRICPLNLLLINFLDINQVILILV